MAVSISRDDLARLCPRPSRAQAAAIWDGYVDAICGAGGILAQFGISTPLRWAHLVATWAHETGGFAILWESGAYSASRIGQIFGPGRHSASVGPSEAARLAGNAYALFERVYGIGNPRMAKTLGNREAGDGYNFRGLGIQQLTGRWAHERYAGKIGCALADLAKPINSIHGALLEWQDKGCNAHADADDVVRVRRLINGGRNGLADVAQYVERAKAIWPSLTAEPDPEPEAELPAGSARDIVPPAKEHQEAHETLKQESWWYSAWNWGRKKLGLPVAGSAAGASMLDDPMAAVGTVVSFVKAYGLPIVAASVVLLLAVEAMQAIHREKAKR